MGLESGRNGKGNRTNRIDRIDSELERELYQIISRKLKDPLITAMVSVTGVVTSRDLSSAKVYVSVFSTDEKKKSDTFTALKADAKKIKYLLSQSVILRRVPELEFILDDSISYGDKMDKLFLEIQKEKKQ